MRASQPRNGLAGTEFPEALGERTGGVIIGGCAGNGHLLSGSGVPRRTMVFWRNIQNPQSDGCKEA